MSNSGAGGNRMRWDADDRNGFSWRREAKVVKKGGNGWVGGEVMAGMYGMVGVDDVGQ